jgi:putative tryptophan/tyrosine transport system substrate-binding protein
MRRIGLVVVLVASLLAPLAVDAQERKTGKVWRIGFILVEYARIEEILFQQLQELGYVEGQNLVVERRYSKGRAERFAEFAAELVRLNLDIIIVTTTPAVLAVKNATRTIPIVQPNSLDPVGTGLVASLARPGGNFTGTTQQAPDTAAKRLQLLVQAIPHVSTVAVVWNAVNPGNAASWREIQDAARVLGVHVQSREVRGPSDFERIFAGMVRERPGALLLIGDRLSNLAPERPSEFRRRSPVNLMGRTAMLAA